MKILITGITGFVGQYLCEYLINKKNIKIFGTYRWRSKKDNLIHLRKNLELVECDLLDATSVDNTIETIKPDRIFHLAAQSYVFHSWDAPGQTFSTNVIGTINLFEAVRKIVKNCKIHIAGSAEVYGSVEKKQIPIKEENEFKPLSPYSVSKAAQELLAYQYYRSYGLKTLITRAFNHTGPRRPDVFVISNFAKQIMKIKYKLQKPIIYVGDLSVKRDFTDVRDIVRAYWLSLVKCDFGRAYNVCSGKVYSIRQILDMLIDISKVKVKVKKDKLRFRPSDVKLLVGDNTLFREKTNWRPKIDIKKTLKDILIYWEQKIKWEKIREK